MERQTYSNDQNDQNDQWATNRFKYLKNRTRNTIYTCLLSMYTNDTLSCGYLRSNETNKAGFHWMLQIFVTLMSYGQIDPKWNSTVIDNSNSNSNPIGPIELAKIKESIACLLTKGILNNLDYNLIFEFHSYRRRCSVQRIQWINQVYCLLMNAVIDSKLDTESLLSVCFADAMNKSNYHIISVLLENFTISSPNIAEVIIQLDCATHEKNKQNCVNFVLNQICFDSLSGEQIYKIFDWVITNQLSLVLSNLFSKPLFWQNLVITNAVLDDLSIRYAIFMNNFHRTIIEYIYTNPNIFSVKSTDNIAQKLQQSTQIQQLINRDVMFVPIDPGYLSNPEQNNFCQQNSQIIPRENLFVLFSQLLPPSYGVIPNPTPLYSNRYSSCFRESSSSFNQESYSQAIKMLKIN